MSSRDIIGPMLMALAFLIVLAFGIQPALTHTPTPHAVIVTLANHQKVNCVQAGPSIACDWIGGAGRP